jgi:hypothetical protein
MAEDAAEPGERKRPLRNEVTKQKPGERSPGFCFLLGNNQLNPDSKDPSNYLVRRIFLNHCAENHRCHRQRLAQDLSR